MTYFEKSEEDIDKIVKTYIKAFPPKIYYCNVEKRFINSGYGYWMVTISRLYKPISAR